MNELHYIELIHPTNIYGLATVQHGGKTKVVISSQFQVHLVETVEERDKLYWREMELTIDNKPIDAEFIAIDAYEKSPASGSSGGPVVLVAFYKPASVQAPAKAFLSIHGASCSGADNIRTIMKDQQILELPFVPAKLSHLKLTVEGKEETFVLLAGSDQRIHVYALSRENSKFAPVTPTHIPDIPLISASVISFEFYTIGTKRLSAIGCQNGMLQLSIVDTDSNAVVRTLRTFLDGPVSCVKFFTSKTHIKLFGKPDTDEVLLADLHLAVGGAVGYAALFCFVYSEGFDVPFYLPDADSFDTVTAIESMDVDCDGYNELVLSTYGQELLFYKHQPGVLQLPPVVMTAAGRQEGKRAPLEYLLYTKKAFAQPIFAVQRADVIRDGLDELVVTTMYGVHILQHADWDKIATRVAKVVQRLRHLHSLQLELERLSTRKKPRQGG